MAVLSVAAKKSKSKQQKKGTSMETGESDQKPKDKDEKGLESMEVVSRVHSPINLSPSSTIIFHNNFCPSF